MPTVEIPSGGKWCVGTKALYRDGVSGMGVDNVRAFLLTTVGNMKRRLSQTEERDVQVCNLNVEVLIAANISEGALVNASMARITESHRLEFVVLTRDGGQECLPRGTLSAFDKRH
jgi:hypothetical protein